MVANFNSTLLDDCGRSCWLSLFVDTRVLAKDPHYDKQVDTLPCERTRQTLAAQYYSQTCFVVPNTRASLSCACSLHGMSLEKYDNSASFPIAPLKKGWLLLGEQRHRSRITLNGIF